MIKTGEKKQKDNFLLYIPKKSHPHWEEREGNIYLIFYHDRLVEKIIRWLVKKPRITNMKLDDMGTKVWKIIDNNKSVYEVGECLKKTYGESCEPVYERLVLYLRYLNRKGWIRFRKKAYE